jgi:hypothetical protein
MRRIFSAIVGLALMASAGAAAAYERPDSRYDGYGYEAGGDRYGPGPGDDYGYDDRRAPPCRDACGRPVDGRTLPTYGDAAQNYGWPGCGCGRGEISVSNSLFYGGGGVGGYADSGYGYAGGGYGGGYGYVRSGAFAGSRASASASAYSSSNVGVRVGGGRHGGHR